MTHLETYNMVVFDLDDTLFEEYHFTLSGIKAIGDVLRCYGKAEAALCEQAMRQAVKKRQPHFDALENELKRQGLEGLIDIKMLVAVHRAHLPASLKLRAGAWELLECLRCHGVTMGVITDGRSVTQRNKILSLGIGHFFDPDDILISGETGTDKLRPDSFRHFMERYPGRRYWYVGDNPAKDFWQPNRLGWQTVWLQGDSRNVQPQTLEGIGADKRPRCILRDIAEFKHMLGL